MGVVPVSTKDMVFNHEFFILRTLVSRKKIQAVNAGTKLHSSAFELVLHILRILLKISQIEYGIKSVK